MIYIIIGISSVSISISYSTGYLNLSSIQNIDTGNELLRDLKLSIGFGMSSKNTSQLNFGLQFGKEDLDGSLVDGILILSFL